MAAITANQQQNLRNDHYSGVYILVDGFETVDDRTDLTTCMQCIN